MKQEITMTDPMVCRAMANHPNFKSAELYKAEANGHKYVPGETRTLTGLESYPEYNGEKVEITAIRDDGEHGKAYYVKGRINEVVNWVYEYRLS